eukprot:1342090-Amorphochlora_amoeboformis.AAC.1
MHTHQRDIRGVPGDGLDSEEPGGRNGWVIEEGFQSMEGEEIVCSLIREQVLSFLDALSRGLNALH